MTQSTKNPTKDQTFGLDFVTEDLFSQDEIALGGLTRYQKLGPPGGMGEQFFEFFFSITERGVRR